MRKKQKQKIKKRVQHRRIFIPKTKVMITMCNTPLHPETGLPMRHKAKVKYREKVRAGWHIYWRVLLYDDRDRLYFREVIA